MGHFLFPEVDEGLEVRLPGLLQGSEQLPLAIVHSLLDLSYQLHVLGSKGLSPSPLICNLTPK